MTLRAVIVFALMAAIVVPIVVAEMRRFRPAKPRPTAAPRAPRPQAASRPPLRLVVDKDDMDRELAALLAKDARKPDERDT